MCRKASLVYTDLVTRQAWRDPWEALIDGLLPGRPAIWVCRGLEPKSLTHVDPLLMVHIMSLPRTLAAVARLPERRQKHKVISGTITHRHQTERQLKISQGCLVAIFNSTAISTKAAFFSKLCYYTSFQGPKLSGANVVPISQIRMTAIIIYCRKLKCTSLGWPPMT